MDGWFKSYCLSLIAVGYTTAPGRKAIQNGHFLEKLGGYPANAAMAATGREKKPEQWQGSEPVQLNCRETRETYENKGERTSWPFPEMATIR